MKNSVRDRFLITIVPARNGQTFIEPPYDGQQRWSYHECAGVGDTLAVVWKERPNPWVESCCSNCGAMLGFPYAEGLKLTCTCGANFISSVVNRRYTWVCPPQEEP